MNYEFFGITMKTKTGRTLYLKCSDKETKDPYKMLMDWTFNIDNACLWEDYDSCMKFAEKYFKLFDEYDVEQINVNNSMKCYLVQKEELK